MLDLDTVLENRFSLSRMGIIELNRRQTYHKQLNFLQVFFRNFETVSKGT